MRESFKVLSIQTKILLFGILLTNISTFMLSPFLTLYMSRKSFTLSQISIVLSVNLVCQQGMNFFGGLIGDRVGHRKTILAGVGLRITGYLLFAFSEGYVPFLMASAVVGVGGALITPTIKAAIAFWESEYRSAAFSLRNVAVNIGAAIGPVIGGLLYKTSFSVLFLVAAVTYSLFMVLVWIFVKEFKTSQQNILNGFMTVVQDGRIVKLMLITMIFWALYSQLSLTIPLFTKNVLKEESFVSIIFALNGFIVIVLQYHLMYFFEKKFSYKNTLCCGMLFLAVSFLIVLLIPAKIGLVLFVILFTMGEILMGPSIDNLTSTLAPNSGLLGTYLGFVTLGWALGGVVGNFCGSRLYQFASWTGNYWLLWLTYAVIAIIAAILFKSFKRTFSSDSLLV